MIKELVDGYDHFTVYRDERVRDFNQFPVAEEIGGVIELLPNCYRAKPVGKRTVIFAGTEPMDFSVVAKALGRTSFNCHLLVRSPGMKEEELICKIMEKIVTLCGLEDL